MLFGWLIEKFPREMQRGWALIKADLAFWCSVAAVLALLAVSPLWSQRDESDQQGAALVILTAATVLRIVVPPLLLVTAAVLFDAAVEVKRLAWPQVGAMARRRLLPVLVAWLAAAGLSRAVALFAQAVVVAVLQVNETPMSTMRIWAGFVGWVVFLGLMVRFAFVPFLVALDEEREHASGPPTQGRARALLYQLAWPLIESDRMTAEVRTRLLPYLTLGLYAPALAAPVPTGLQLALSFGLHLLSFTALAVLFLYYADRRRPRT
jgi:hypothetical protein